MGIWPCFPFPPALRFFPLRRRCRENLEAFLRWPSLFNGPLNSPARMDQETGLTFKQSPEDLSPLEEAMVAFLRKLRRCNPGSRLFWVRFGTQGTVNGLIEKSLRRYVAEDGDERCELIDLSPMRPTGARNHPGLDVHAAQAALLAERIKALL